MPLFHPSRPSLAARPDSPVDPHFGFAAEVEPGPTPPDAGAEADAAIGVDLALACEALAVAMNGPVAREAAGIPDATERARRLGQLARARILGELATRVEDPRDPLSHEDLRGFLTGEGAGLLRSTADLLAHPAIEVARKCEQLAAMADAADLCVTGLAYGLREALHVLRCAAGGLSKAAQGRRAELVRQTLLEVVRATVGRQPPRAGLALRQFESHYVAALQQRLGLVAPAADPRDQFFRAGELEEGVVRRARAALKRVTPAAVAISLAEEALEGLRASMRAADGGSASTPSTAYRDGWKAVEERVDAVDPRVLFGDGDDTGAVPVLDHAEPLAVQILSTLMARGLLARIEIGTVLRWREEDAPRRLRHLGESLWWVQSGQEEPFDPAEAEPVRAWHLRQLDHERWTCRLNEAQCEGLARNVIALEPPDVLATLPPRWLASTGLASRWWHRMGAERCGEWLSAHRASALPEAVRHRLLAAALQARDGASAARLMPTDMAAAARAWIECDGTGAVAAAARRGDAPALRLWQPLLLRGARSMTASERGTALAARDDVGATALCVAMALENGEEVVQELATLTLTLRGQGQPLTPPIEVLLDDGGRGLGAIGVALASGRAGSLRVFLQVLDTNRRLKVLSLSSLRDILLSASGLDGSEDLDGLSTALRRDHAEAARVWLDRLHRAAREGMIAVDEFHDAIGVPREDGRGVYVYGMEAGSSRATATYREALIRGRREGLLTPSQVLRLLLGDADGQHPVRAAAANRRSACVMAHLAEERWVLGIGEAPSPGDLGVLRWQRCGGHVALREAMRIGHGDTVAVLLAHAQALQRQGWRQTLFPAFQGGLAGTPAIRDVVLRVAAMDDADSDPAVRNEAPRDDLLQAARAWMEALATLAAEGVVRRRDMRTLLAAADPRGERLFDTAARRLEPSRLTRLLAMTTEAVRHAGWSSSDVVKLLGRQGRRPATLAVALTAGRAESVRALGAALLHLHIEGVVDGAGLRALTGLLDRRRRCCGAFPRWPAGIAPGGLPALRRHLPADRPLDAAACAAYRELLDEARSRGAVSADEARTWGAADATDAATATAAGASTVRPGS